jgi:ferritin-like metal-binding protein YciE
MAGKERPREPTVICSHANLGVHGAARLMQETLEAERNADTTLNQLAQRSLNQQVARRAA